MEAKIKDIKKLKTLDEVMVDNGFKDEDMKAVNAYKFFYDVIYALEDNRKARGMTQEKLAEKSGVPRPEISKILNGEVKQVSAIRLFKLMTALNMQIELK